MKGRLLNEIDILQNRKVCIIGERVEEVLFEKGEDPIGEYIKINGVYFQVVGVFGGTLFFLYNIEIKSGLTKDDKVKGEKIDPVKATEGETSQG